MAESQFIGAKLNYGLGNEALELLLRGTFDLREMKL
jgi:hypothetical protein